MNTYEYADSSPFQWADRMGLSDTGQPSNLNPSNSGFSPGWLTWLVGELGGGIVTAPTGPDDVVAGAAGAALDGGGTNPFDLVKYVKNQCSLDKPAQAPISYLSNADQSTLGYTSNADLSQINNPSNFNWFERLLIKIGALSDPNAPPQQ